MSNTPRRGLGLAALGAALLIGLTACGESAAEPADSGADSGASDPDTLVFGAIPYENATNLQQDYQPLIDLIAEETGKEVQFEVVTDYAGIIEGQRAGTIHIAQYGPFSYVLARDTDAGVEPVGVQVDGPGEDPSYLSYAVTAPDSGITSLADMEGQQICFVDQSSTSGFLYPTAGLLEAGLEEGDYESVFAGGHDASALAVRDGDCDAGFVFDDMFDVTLPEQGDLQEGDLEVIWESEPIVNSPLAITSSLSDELRTTIATAVQERGNADELDVEAIGGYWGYEAVEDDFFDPIRNVCELTQAEACQTG